MAAEIRPLPAVKFAAGPVPRTPDQKYFARFANQVLIPSHNKNPITSITTPCIQHPSSASALGAPSLDTFAVTTGGLLQIYSSRTRKPLKTISRLDAGNNAHSAHIRRDGKVVVSGSDKGEIQVFDINSRAILKTWQESKQPVWVTRWRDQGPMTDLMSCGDDKAVRLWDLTEGKSTRKFFGHQDYVRSGDWMTGVGGSGASLLVSGSYDQTVRLWDGRVGEGDGGGNVMTFQLAAPVEAVLPMPAGTTLLASADNTVAVLDLVAARPLQLLKNHQKTVTSLALASRGTRVLTGALDGHVKVFETKSWNVVAGSKYQAPILSLAVMPEGVSQEDRHILVGLQSGFLSIKTRLSAVEKTKAKEKAQEMQALVDGRIEEYDRRKKKRDRRNGKAWERRMRGKDFTGEGADIIIDGNQRSKVKQLAPWEKALRKGQYEKALDIALENNSREAAVSLFTALRHRSALRTALKGRDEVTLQPVLKWLLKAIGAPRTVKLTTDIAFVILDLYAENMGQSAEVDRLIGRLHAIVRKNVEISQVALSTLGMIEILGAS